MALNSLHSAEVPLRNCSLTHSPVEIVAVVHFTDRMPFLTPSQQHESTESSNWAIHIMQI